MDYAGWYILLEREKMCHVIGLCPPQCDTLCTSGFTDGVISARKLEEEVTQKAHVLKPAQQAAARIGQRGVHSDLRRPTTGQHRSGGNGRAVMYAIACVVARNYLTKS